MKIEIQWSLMSFVVIICIGILSLVNASEVDNGVIRKFEVDYDNNQFLMNRNPFKYISGSFHYFRAFPQRWRNKLRAMRAAGLNTVSTYVEWSHHNPKDGIYLWNGMSNLEEFIKTAEQENLFVILRPGPYICAERDMGGLPHWLLHKYPNIKLRTSDPDYLFEVRRWYNELMPKIAPYLFGNGGPVIMVQIENEYGSFGACDKKYGVWLRNETESHVQGKALLFTTDGPGSLNCGHIENVFATVDFGASSYIQPYWTSLRKIQPKGPLVNSEFYPGWLTHWQEKFQRVDTHSIIYTMNLLFQSNASFNFYMFFGGTNFGFKAGANDGGPGSFNADITSYDYDAPLDEAGDPTDKYYAIRNTIGQYAPLPHVPLPIKQPKMKIEATPMKPITVILSHVGRRFLGSTPIQSDVPISFEALNQFSGLVLYEAYIPSTIRRDPSLLTVKKLRDRALVYANRNFLGAMSRENQITSLPYSLNYGRKLQILVENQGRINYNVANDFKGILGDVLIDNIRITNWTITGFPLDNYERIEHVIQRHLDRNKKSKQAQVKSFLITGPTIFYGEFFINDTTVIYDTYLDPSAWGKGIVFINGFNLGRYWPLVGPQVTLYVPKEILVTGVNKIVMLEYQSAPESPTIQFNDTPILG